MRFAVLVILLGWDSLTLAGPCRDLETPKASQVIYGVTLTKAIEATIMPWHQIMREIVYAADIEVLF